MLLVSPARHQQDPQALEHAQQTAAQHPWLIAVSMVTPRLRKEGRTTQTKRGNNKRRRSTRGRSKQAGSRYEETPINQETKLNGTANRHLNIRSRGLDHGKSFQTTFRRRLHRHICPRRLGTRSTTENQQQDRIGNNRQSHCSNTPNSCEIGMNFSRLHQSTNLSPNSNGVSLLLWLFLTRAEKRCVCAHRTECNVNKAN